MRTTKAQISCLDSVMSLVFLTKISSLLLASVAEHASLSLTWSETSEDTFSHDEAHIHVSVPSNVYAEPPSRTRDATPCLKLTLVLYMSCSLTKWTKWPLRPAKTQLSPDWSVFAVRLMSTQRPKLSSCGQRRFWSDWAIARLIWVFALRTVILLVLSCCGSYCVSEQWRLWQDYTGSSEPASVLFLHLCRSRHAMPC